MPDPPVYPLRFEPVYKETVWGGRRLERVGRALPGDAAARIGESWEICDLDATSASGGGGEAAHSVVANGSLRGSTIGEVTARYGPALVGRLETGEGFPLLIKYLDAMENLSVQVHPSAEYAVAHADAHLKSEAWYVVDAEPGSAIWKGIREGTTPDVFRAAIESGDRARIESLMIRVPVRPGDCHYLPSGTCHALGEGVFVAEVQTPSDTTFRVYDWGRTDRELHVEQAMQCMAFGPAEVESCERRSHVAGMFTTVTRLVLCEHFRIEKVRMSEGYEQEIPYDQPTIWMVLEGGGTIETGNGAEAVDFERGQTLLVPAAMDEAKVRLAADTSWLEVTFPQALPERIA